MDDAMQPTSSGPVIPLRLTLVSGGSSITLTQQDMLVGRHSDADVRLHLPDVSRRHCRFRFCDGTWRVYDLQSTNGVFVNDERVGQAELHNADVVRIGGYTFEVQVPADPAVCRLAS
jgi:pSer/pThr/pTyr-binding forkhead associated (FHA) protein